MQNAAAPSEPPPPSANTAAAQGARQANILAKAVRGAFWTVLSGTGARVVGILGTLAVTHYLSPEEYGEVSMAGLVILTASGLANAGISQYIASKPNADRAAVFHATFYFLLLGVLALALTLMLGEPAARLVNAPGIVKYLPLFSVGLLIERVCVIQDRIQVRDMRFRTVGLIRSLGELVYAVVSVALAATCAGTRFGGGNALVWAMVVRSVVRLLAFSTTTYWRDWAEPHPITLAQTREFFGFGLPMSLAGIANWGSAKFDNFVYSHHFGEAAVGQYNLAYNFADVPAALIAETVGDVLVPSFAHMENVEQRRRSYLVAIETLVLLVTPLALGLAAVAPDLVKLAFPAKYAGITIALRILVLFGVPRTVIWTANSYLQVRNKPRIIMNLEMARMLGIVLLVHGFTWLGRQVLPPSQAQLVACAAVVSVFALNALGYMLVIRRVDGVSLGDQILPLLPPALACVPMVLAVYGIQNGLERIPFFAVADEGALHTFGERARAFGPRLLLSVVGGAIVFVPSALALAPKASRRLLSMVRNARARRRGGAS